MLAQITLPAKWSYAPVTVKFVSYAPAPTEHPLYLRGGACKPFYCKPFCFHSYFHTPSPLRGTPSILEGEFASRSTASRSAFDGKETAPPLR